MLANEHAALIEQLLKEQPQIEGTKRFEGRTRFQFKDTDGNYFFLKVSRMDDTKFNLIDGERFTQYMQDKLAALRDK